MTCLPKVVDIGISSTNNELVAVIQWEKTIAELPVSKLREAHDARASGSAFGKILTVLEDAQEDFTRGISWSDISDDLYLKLNKYDASLDFLDPATIASAAYSASRKVAQTKPQVVLKPSFGNKTDEAVEQAVTAFLIPVNLAAQMRSKPAGPPVG